LQKYNKDQSIIEWRERERERERERDHTYTHPTTPFLPFFKLDRVGFRVWGSSNSSVIDPQIVYWPKLHMSSQFSFVKFSFPVTCLMAFYG
jgi:hypothetical protein